MAKIEKGLYSQALRRIFSMVGQDVVAADLSPEVSPTVELERLSDPEMRFLRGERPVRGTSQIAATAVAQAYRLSNPRGSNALAILDQASFRLAALSGEQVSLDLITAYLMRGEYEPIAEDIRIPDVSLDSRWVDPGGQGPARSARCSLWTNNGQTRPSDHELRFFIDQSPGQMSIYTGPFVLGPGWHLDFYVGFPADPRRRLICNFLWREREADALQRGYYGNP